MKKIIISPKQLNEILCEDYDTKALNKIQKKIYKSVSGFCGKMHSDTGWQDVKKLIEIIDSVDGVDEVYVSAGEYFNYTNPEKGAHRDYDLTVETPFGKLYGYIRCHAAGTTDDIFKYYDMTISLYPDKKRDMEERLGEMNEAASLMYSAPASNVQSVAQTAMAKHPGQQITIDVTDNTPGTNGTIGFSDTTANTNPSQIKNFDKMTFNSNTGVTQTSLEESRYSKRQVELGRMLEMRKNGKVYSKRQFEKLLK